MILTKVKLFYCFVEHFDVHIAICVSSCVLNNDIMNNDILPLACLFQSEGDQKPTCKLEWPSTLQPATPI